MPERRARRQDVAAGPCHCPVMVAAVRTGVWCCLVVVWIGVSLMAAEAGHLHPLVCRLRVLFVSLAGALTGLFALLLLSLCNSLQSPDTVLCALGCQRFLLVPARPFILFTGSFPQQRF